MNALLLVGMGRNRHVGVPRPLRQKELRGGGTRRNWPVFRHWGKWIAQNESPRNVSWLEAYLTDGRKGLLPEEKIERDGMVSCVSQPLVRGHPRTLFFLLQTFLPIANFPLANFLPLANFSSSCKLFFLLQTPVAMHTTYQHSTAVPYCHGVMSYLYPSLCHRALFGPSLPLVKQSLVDPFL